MTAEGVFMYEHYLLLSQSVHELPRSVHHDYPCGSMLGHWGHWEFLVSMVYTAEISSVHGGHQDIPSFIPTKLSCIHTSITMDEKYTISFPLNIKQHLIMGHGQQTSSHVYGGTCNINPRHESVATDTIFSDTPAVYSGVKQAQLFVGRDSLVADVYPMKSGKQFVNTLEDTIRRWGISNKVMEIFRAYLYLAF